MSNSKLVKSLDTNDLNLIDEILTYCKFSKSKWFKLGLKLGLYHNTLQTIEANHSQKSDGVERCFSECLYKWLSKADNVAPPTGLTLSEALDGINKSVADKVDQIMTNPVSQYLFQCLEKVTFRKELIEQFKADGVIITDETRRHNLLAMCTIVAEDPSKLKTIGEALILYDDCKSHGEKLLQEYSRLFPSNDVTSMNVSQSLESQNISSLPSINSSCHINTTASLSTTLNADSLPVPIIPESMDIMSELPCVSEFESDKSAKRKREKNTEENSCSLEDENSSSDVKKMKREIQLKQFSEDKIRSYQKELARTAIEGKNCIICAPTGSGKTLVAALIIYDHLKNKNKKGRVLFVVRTQQLAYQQTQKLREYLNGVEVIEITGDTESLICSSLPQVDIIVCTAGKLANEFESAETNFNISTATLLILDECHHTVGIDPYAIIMENYLINLRNKFEAAVVPQVVGMTASPGAGRGKYPSMAKALGHQMKLCARLNATSGIKCVQENKEELMNFVPKPSHESHTLPQRNPGEQFIAYLTQAMNVLEGMLPRSSLPTFDRCSNAYQMWIKQEIEESQLSGMEQQRDQISILELLEAYYIARITFDDFEIGNALEIIEEVKIKEETSLNKIEKEIQQIHIDLKRNLSQIKSQRNPLLQRAEDLLCRQFSNKRDSKALFFVRDIRHTDYVTDWIKSRAKLSALVKPCSISGYSRKKAMTKDEQINVIEAFRDGTYNLLVTTSVLEEGLDVPECNMIIRFQIMSNEVAEVQAQGRARAEDSTMHTIITSDSHMHHNLLLNSDKKILAMKAVELLSCQLENDSFNNEIKRIQNEMLLQRKERIQLQKLRKKTWNFEDVNLCCCKCGAVACKAADVCKYGKPEAPHYVVPLASFVTEKMEKVNRKEKPEPEVLAGDFTRPFKIACRRCHEEWGIWGCWKNSGVQYPVLKCEKFTFHNTKIDCRNKVKKWKNVPFELLFYSAYIEQD